MSNVCDRFCFDAYPYQILGPGHREQLGGLPPGARGLHEGMWELAVGEPAAWMLDTTDPGFGTWSHRRADPAVRTRARELLAACLLSREEGSEARRQRMQEWDEGGIDGHR